ncbi:uncharacterized protein [Nicotiana sylvestris]|uniref:uncharacterized protein n=1 Tax=Nicotiana sylvestris TaxID=4096 RepID=UPI00388C4679
MVGKGCLAYLTFVSDVGADPPTLDAVSGGRVIAYSSRELKPQEKNYPVHDLDLAATIHALKIWRHYFYGVSCEVFTDHESLQHLFKQKDLNLRQQKWSTLLKNYDIIILYHLGKANMVADALSRNVISMGNLAYIPVGERAILSGVQALANQFMRLDVSETCQSISMTTVLKDTVQHGDAKEVSIGEDEVLWIQRWICVPNVDGLHELILEEAHSLRYSILPGAAKMYRDLR